MALVKTHLTIRSSLGTRRHHDDRAATYYTLRPDRLTDHHLPWYAIVMSHFSVSFFFYGYYLCSRGVRRKPGV